MRTFAETIKLYLKLDRLLNILESVLGESKSGIDDNGQAQFMCPQCSENHEHNYKLEVNLNKNLFRCWVCGDTDDMHGPISKLIKEYGGVDVLSQYKREIKEIKASSEYELNLFSGNGIIIEDDEEDKIKLPDHTYNFKFDGNYKESKALQYLIDRGFDENQITKYRLQYTTYDCKDKKWRNRVIIPSHNKYGELSFYTGRDYSGKAFQKYMNVGNFGRKEVIFNENLINWDGDITLVEGPIDHTSVPNSIPLMGKSLNDDYYLFECLLKTTDTNIIVFLDNDATADSNKICKKLSDAGLCGRIKFVPSEKLRIKINNGKNINLDKLDPGKLYELYGYKGIAWAIKNSEVFECI